MQGSRFFGLGFLFLLTFHISKAEVKPHALFSDHMVLQQEMVLPIWGMADPGEKVIVNIGAFRAETITDSEGKWMVRIGPLKAGGPLDISLYGKDTLRVKDVLVGEVWVCSGQSNMAMEVRNCLNADKEIASANYPRIRHFQVKRTKATVAMEDLVTEVKGRTSWLNSWEICDPSTVGHFSGAAYFFARDFYNKYNIPVGIIHASWGGTTAEAWTPRDTLESDKELKDILRDWPAYNEDEEWLSQEYQQFVLDLEKARENGQEKPLYFNQPSVLFNGIIAPVIPYAIRGAIWYQGESNRGLPYKYRKMLPGMIDNWRKDWNQGDFPFYYVQIAPFNYNGGVNSALLREAQLLSLKTTNTGMAVTMDIGNTKDIHPRNKKDVGYRLALWALAKDYGFTNIVFSGPLYKNMIIDGNKIVLSFDYCDGLKSSDGKPLSHFEIAGDDKNFLPAVAEINADKIIVSCNKIEKPVAVRYGWSHTAEPNLCNNAGLPASSFRTDDWQ